MAQGAQGTSPSHHLCPASLYLTTSLTCLTIHDQQIEKFYLCGHSMGVRALLLVPCSIVVLFFLLIVLLIFPYPGDVRQLLRRAIR